MPVTPNDARISWEQHKRRVKNELFKRFDDALQDAANRSRLEGGSMLYYKIHDPVELEVIEEVVQAYRDIGWNCDARWTSNSHAETQFSICFGMPKEEGG